MERVTLRSQKGQPMTPNMTPSYLTESEFCERYHVAPRTAQRWRVSGEGPSFVRMGLRRIAYRLEDCERWAAERTFAHRAAELAARPKQRSSRAGSSRHV